MTNDTLNYLDVSWRSTLLLCLVCPVLATSLTLFFRQIETLASRYLALFLVFFCINVVPQIIGFSGFYQAFPWLTFAPFNNELWLGPLLLLHCFALTKYTTPPYLKLLILPGIVQTLYYLIVFLSIDTYQQKWTYNDNFHMIYIVPVETLLTIGISVFCAWRSYKQIALYKQHLLQLESDQSTYDVSWLKWMSILVFLLFSVWSMFEIAHSLVDGLSYIDQYPFHVCFMIIILFLGQRALASIRLPYPAPLAAELNADDTQKNEGYESEHQKQLVSLIERGLLHYQWYLNQQFSLSDLARAVNSNESYVSKAINLGLGKNFNQLINEARVEHAKKLLTKQIDYKVTDLIFDCGFSSKASFNRSFKQYTGLTPSAYQAKNFSTPNAP